MALKRFPIASFSTTGGTVPETKTLLTAEALKETIMLSFFVSNYSATDNAVVLVAHTDGTNTLFEFRLELASGSGPFALDSMWIMEAGDKIDVTSDIDAVSVLTSADVS